ncbi:TIGR01777 family protein [Lujinxingia sediminis]|uniref:TIGR01777 family protein n=1 Tax=Lujinxingia sediminis TaxID=2480984 RepID=A0ABY0CP07_9DELT|nr:TIGR01777 family oxidoreductase [Lujinxingia sediminis]RVU42181.1 TIGR01777 family protein [Lujinxingia sediminis]
MPEFSRRTGYPVSSLQLYNWHARPGAFERLVPPWESIEVLEQSGGIADGARLVMRIQQGPVGVIWEAHHRDHIEGHQFVDEQVRGPFKHWRHTHRFEALGPEQSLLIDEVDYALPMGALGNFFGGGFADALVESMFAFRHRRTGDDLRRHQALSPTPLRVAVSGSSGTLGRALVAFLSTGGHEVYKLVRRRAMNPDEIAWSVETGEVEQDKLEGLDAVVHLAGEPVLGERWSTAKRRRIEESRVRGTTALARALAGLSEPPKVFLSASAIGFYGDRGEEALDEDSEAGEGFLAGVCQRWEEATEAARSAGLRVVHLRIGQVLDPRHGAFAELRRAQKLGGASRIASGTQFMSWIDLDDVLGAILFLMNDTRGRTLEGPVNLVAPRAQTNAEVMATMARVLGGMKLVPVPGATVKTILGADAARETALASQRVVPRRLIDAGFEFFYPELDEALAMKFGVALHPEASEG